jgi:hypothetical protein
MLVIGVCRWVHPGSYIDSSAYCLGIMTMKEEVINCFIAITETIFFLLPFQFFLSKLSFVRLAPPRRIQRKILILRGFFYFPNLFVGKRNMLIYHV